MDWLRDLLETNRIVVLMVYGQVFFVLGLAVALQSRSRSRLPLARPLVWLAGFGIAHAFVEWGYLFVPIQAGWLPQPLVELLLVLQLLLKAISFALLMQFGAELVLSAGGEPSADARGPLGQPWLRLAPAGVVLLWIVATLSLSATVARGFVPEPSPWLSSAEIGAAIAVVGAPLAVGDVTARLLLALPGAALVVMGLRRTQQTLGPLAAPPVGPALQVAAAAFGVYAVFGGLVGMVAPFPPASVLNSRAVLDALGIPIEVFRGVAGLGMAVGVIGSMQLFERETDRILADARRRELLLRERERIGRDLHDGIVQSIYAAGLHLEAAAAGLDPGATATRKSLGTVMSELNRITADIRSTIFDLRSGELASHDAESIVRDVAAELRANTLVEIDVRVEGDYVPRLSAQQADHMRHIATEAFSNVLRHAHAKHVAVRLACTRRRLTLEVSDDGVGYDPAARSTARGGRGGRRGQAQGLDNMRRRAELLGGRCITRSTPGRGTLLSLTMPVATTRRPA